MKHILFIMIMLVGFVEPSFGQVKVNFCDRIVSTASSISCLKKQLQSNQNDLNIIYDEYVEKLELESLGEFKDLQKTWLNYRDAECMWEAQQPVETPLKLAQELSCMNELTQDRIDVLNSVYEKKKVNNKIIEPGSLPRWMNVIAKEKPDIFWNYGVRLSNDLNCDDTKEFIMQGVQTLAVERDEKELFSKHTIIAIAENPMVGKPKITYFKALDDSGLGNCSALYDVDVVTEEKIKAGACKTRIDLTAKDCQTQTILWNGKSFQLDVKELETIKKD